MTGMDTDAPKMIDAGGVPDAEGARLGTLTVWVFVALVFAQGLAHAIRCVLLLAGREMTDDEEAIVTDERV